MDEHKITPPAARPGRAVGHAVRHGARALEYLCSLSLFAIVAVTFVDVIGRYVIDKPLPGASEYIQFAMALTIFAGLPLITRTREHISVELLNYLKGPLRRVKLVFVDTMSLAAVLLLARQLYIQAKDYAEVGTGTTVLDMPMAPLAATMAVLAAITVLVLARMLWDDIRFGDLE